MAAGLIGKKLGMTQIFNEDGSVEPVTVIEAGPCQVIQKKTPEKEGYTAVQLGFGEQKVQRLTKAVHGHLKKNNAEPVKILREFRDFGTELNVGDKVDTSVFEGVEHVKITGKSKGKGFQGVVKRHGFHGGPMSHGSRFHNRPGAIGACADPAKVFKGTKMPGRKGFDTKTVSNLKICRIDAEKNLIMVRGAIPGKTQGIVYIEAQ